MTRIICNDRRRQSIKNRFLFFRAGWRILKDADFNARYAAWHKQLLRFLGNWVINTLAVLVAVHDSPRHIIYGDNGLLPPIITALVLGILNAFVRPILMLIALPLLIFTLGLFTLVINALLLYFVGVLLAPHFQVDSFGSAFLGALIISIVSIALNVLTGMTAPASPFNAARPRRQNPTTTTAR